MAQDFVEQFDIPYPVYTDAKRVTYKAMNFKRSTGLKLSSVRLAARAVGRGNVQGATTGDIWQQGGEALFDTDGTVLWAHSAKMAGTHTPIPQLLKTVMSALSEK